MLKRFPVMLLGVMALVISSLAFAGETDILIQKLVEKGVLTPYEAQILKDETAQEVNKQNAKGENAMIPTWVQTSKLMGDVRLRYQTQQKEGGTVRNRGRVRMRLGLEASPSEKVALGVGISGAEKGTGMDDARSTNQTLKSGFDRGQLRLDYAYANYKPNTNLAMIGGKYNAHGMNYLWYTTDMMWDGDINQEGVSVHGETGNLFANAGYWSLNESAVDASDLGMFYSQAGTAFELTEAVKIELAGVFYGLQNNDSHSLTPTAGSSGNTLNGGAYAYDFGQIYAGSAQATYSLSEEISFPIKILGIFGDYVMNPDPSNNNTGYAVGFKFGHKKASGPKTWQFKYQYVRLAKDAWLDALPDSDRYSGNTNIKSHETILDIGLARNVSLGLDYYHAEILTGTHLPENVFQADLLFKF